MRLAVAFLGVFVLLVPLVGLLGSRAEQPPCCSGTLCPFTGQHAHRSPAPQQTDCDHAAPSPADCAMKSGCGPEGQYGVLGPLPPIMLQSDVELPAPGITRALFSRLRPLFLPAFDSVPSPPPRS